MNNTIVFEGADEVLVVSAGNLNNFIEEWFLEGERNLDEYNVYVTDADAGFQISTRVKFSDDQMKDFDVTEMMPNHLRKAMIDAELLIDES